MNISKSSVIPDDCSHDDLKLSFQHVEGSSNTIIIEPIGSITFDNAVYFEERMNLLIDDGYTKLYFDMSNTKYVSAVGIGSFIHLLTRVKKSGGSVVLDRMQTNVLEVFQLPGIVDYFTINVEKDSTDLSVKDNGVESG